MFIKSKFGPLVNLDFADSIRIVPTWEETYRVRIQFRNKDDFASIFEGNTREECEDYRDKLEIKLAELGKMIYLNEQDA